MRSHLWGSWRQGAPGPRLRTAGTSGSYLIADADGQEARLRSGASPASVGQRWGVEPDQRTHQPGTTPGADHLTSVRDIHRDAVKARRWRRGTHRLRSGK